MLMLIRYPDTVPVLTARDMQKGGHGGLKRCSLLGHARNTFLSTTAKAKPVEEEFKHRGHWLTVLAIRRAAKHLLPAPMWIENITRINDEVCQTNEQRAHIWNLAMAMLGYTEGNPGRYDLINVSPSQLFICDPKEYQDSWSPAITEAKGAAK